MEAVFGIADVGCYGDEACGHAHIRSRLADLVEAVTLHPSDDAEAVMASLRGPMPDDAWDEDEAIDILEGYTDEGVTWAIDGGLCLFTVDEFVG